jgi:protein O-mannosyl-transferase
MTLKQATNELPSRALAWRIVGVALLASATIVSYWPALRGTFVLDDDDLIAGSRLVHASDGLYRFWCTKEPTDYWPLTNSGFWIQWRLWGTEPTGYHAVNIALQIAAALILWAILHQLAIPGAYLAALIFALHPVNVESVAWIAQLKNTLAMPLFLSAIWCYLKFDAVATDHNSVAGVSDTGAPAWQRPATTWCRFSLSLLAFTLAMLSKGSAAVLPGLLVLILWWQRGQLGRRDLAPLIPLFVIAIALTIVNVWFQKHGQNIEVRDVSFAQRLAGAGAVVWFYLSKAFLPLNLAFIYPQWQIDARALRWWLPLAAATAVTIVLFWRRHTSWGRALLFAWLWFCIALVPVLGFTDVGFMQYSLVADHYQHIAVIGAAALVAAIGGTFYQRILPSKRPAIIAAAALLSAGLAFLTYRQSEIYAGPIPLYEDTLAKNPDCWPAHNNLGMALRQNGQAEKAIAHYNAALRLKSNYPEAHYNLGNALLDLGHTRDAIAQYQRALAARPEYALAESNWGAALIKEGRQDEAIEHYERAIALDPNYADPHNNLGAALANLGKTQDAIDQFQRAVELKPDFAQAHSNLAVQLMKAGRAADAIAHFQQAIRAKPDYLPGYMNLATGYAETGRFPEAITTAQAALKLARASGQSALASQIEKSLAEYRARAQDQSK